MITRAFQDDPDIEIVGSAANGVVGLSKIPELKPDIVTLDVEMPEMDGLEMLRRLREKSPEPLVIMLSTLTEPGATATLDALMLGANDYVTKPSHSKSPSESIEVLRNELAPKVRQFFHFGQALAPGQAPAPPAKKASSVFVSPAPLYRREVLAIGVSTGGPHALSDIIPMLPKSFPLPILIVQHMPPLFTRLLAERLQAISQVPVAEGTHGAAVEPGKVLIAPGGFHMRVRKSGQDVSVVIDDSERRNSCRPSVDVLFESVNEVYGKATIAAVLTGMGQDGLQGAQALKAKGAYLIAQDEASSVVWGMPGFVVRAGIADAVLPLHEVIPEVLRQSSLVSVAASGWRSQ